MLLGERRVVLEVVSVAVMAGSLDSYRYAVCNIVHIMCSPAVKGLVVSVTLKSQQKCKCAGFDTYGGGLVYDLQNTTYA